MKAIKGLEDRLYALDQMIASCGRLVNEQKELAQVLLSDFSQENKFVITSILCAMAIWYVPCFFFILEC